MAERKRKRQQQSNETKILTTASGVRIETPRSKRGEHHESTVSVIVNEVNPVKGFLGFLREYSVVSLAVGFAIATQAQTVIKQLISSFIDPLYGLLFNGQKLSAMTSTFHWHGREQAFAWGAFVYALIDFIFVLAIIYLLIKLFNLDELSKPKDKK
ncbi:MAG: putative Large-conductance mechanosensitive channel-like protein [Candidatus Saccharibacteria bacterium]|nr:putative Large-conductance mechanosensitive channel-like protein [Candidatus Saccharibacteria bacterium]